MNRLHFKLENWLSSLWRMIFRKNTQAEYLTDAEPGERYLINRRWAMIKERVTHCDFCGLLIEQAGEDCPLCHYPLDPEKEERFLLSAIDDLQRVVNYGGSNLRVSDLLTRYRSRLETLRLQQSMAVPVPAAPAVAEAPRVEVAPPPVVAPAAAHS